MGGLYYFEQETRITMNILAVWIKRTKTSTREATAVRTQYTFYTFQKRRSTYKPRSILSTDNFGIK